MFAMINLRFIELFAQAGGGGNFGGGGGGFGGGGGDGEGLLILIELLLRLTLRYPHIGIPLSIVIAIGLFYAKQAGTDYHVTRTIRRGRKLQEEGLKNSSLGLIQQRDPEFNIETFLQRVTNAFITTQHAWSDQDLRRCRAFISDGVRERFDLYLRMQQAENFRNRMSDVEVLQNEVVSITTDEHFDTIHVRIAASAVIRDEDLTTGEPVGHDLPQPRQFTEVWSFSRRPGVPTNPDSSVLQGRCPNCGGPVDIVDKAECPQCRSTVNSGKFDWVLAEITQDEEWVVPPVRHTVAGWEAMQEADPGLNFQHLEDRASVIFWRAMMAVYFDDLQYARPVLAADQTSLPSRWARPGEFWKTPAVGVVEVTRCEPAEHDEFDRMVVLVRWSATRAKGDRKNPQRLGQQKIYAHAMILKRKRGAASNTDMAFASCSCTNCGAPIDTSSAAACGFCGTALNDGERDWVLEDVQPHGILADLRREDRQDQQMAAAGGTERLETDRFLNEPELLTALSRILTVDGELHEKERAHIVELAERRGVPQERLKTIFNTATADEIPIRLPENRSQADLFMDHLLRAALVDGKVTRSEFDLLLKTATQIGWSVADLKIAIAAVRRELFQQAKQILRKRRKNQ